MSHSEASVPADNRIPVSSGSAIAAAPLPENFLVDENSGDIWASDGDQHDTERLLYSSDLANSEGVGYYEGKNDLW